MILGITKRLNFFLLLAVFAISSIKDMDNNILTGSLSDQKKSFNVKRKKGIELKKLHLH